MNPKVKMLKKNTIDPMPSHGISRKATAQGNKNAVSKSNIINKIATRKKRMSKGVLASSNASKPHSKAAFLVLLGLFGVMPESLLARLMVIIPIPMPRPTIARINIPV